MTRPPLIEALIAAAPSGDEARVRAAAEAAFPDVAETARDAAAGDVAAAIALINPEWHVRSLSQDPKTRAWSCDLHRPNARSASGEISRYGAMGQSSGCGDMALAILLANLDAALLMERGVYTR